MRNLPRVFTLWCRAETRTCDLLITSPTLYHNATTPSVFFDCVLVYCMTLLCYFLFPRKFCPKYLSEECIMVKVCFVMSLKAFIVCRVGLKKPGFFLKKSPTQRVFLGFNGFY